MATMVTMLELTRPDCLDDRQWEAVSEHDARLARALRDNDAALMLGTAKDLCEAVAKITCQQCEVGFQPAGKLSNLIHR